MATPLKPALERPTLAANALARGSDALMTSRSTTSLTSESRDSAAATLRAGHVSYPARSSAWPSQKANPKSSSTIRTVFTCLNLQILSRKQSIRQNVSVLLSNTCHVVSGESSAKVEVGREKV